MTMTRRDVLWRALASGLALGAAWPVPVQADAVPDLLADIGLRLETSPVLRGDFEQTKTLKGFKRPLVSHGVFVMARGKGVLWTTKAPFASTLVVTRERLVTVTEGSTQQIDTRQEPGLRAVNDMLMALLAGDLQALASRFNSAGSLQGAQGWRVSLTPRDAALARFIARIELEGDRHVRQVRLAEASGDDSRIVFSNHAASTLSPAEAERLN
ncbi:outer membrane lipoprotein carrier protein LolA [Aquabacterium sp.]|uniref:outer membrane lipoprotein carrier protein LolA n=1 Tax=Aquabacterium sp. TaxID=1872578 RepID=UPI003D6D01BE